MNNQTIPLPSTSLPRRCSDVNDDSNMMSYLNSNNIESLPDELLFDILVLLPAETLRHSARLVCRRWRHIVRSYAFISTHIQQHSTYGLLLSLSSFWGRPHAIYVTVTQGRIETCELSCINSNEITTTSSSCSGLTLGYNGRSLHVINPATKQSFSLPSIPEHVNYHVASIAHSAASMEYKVTLSCHDYGQGWHLYIVTVGVDKSWRHVGISHEYERSFFDSFSPWSSEGFLHWGRGRYCLTLNVETEMFTMSEVPIRHRDYYWYYYLSTGRYLTLLVGGGNLSWKVWEMRPEESGVQWVKVLPDIDLEDKRCMLQQLFGSGYFKHCLRPVGWVNYPAMLVFCFSGKTCIHYNLETHEIDKFDLPHKKSRDYTALVHKNSLVWLCQD